MRIVQSIVAVTGLLAASGLSAQTIKAPAAATAPTAGALHTAGNAAALAPTTHEIVAPAVAGTVPATRPFTQGVTAATKDVATGVYNSGGSVNHDGVNVQPTGGVSPTNRGHEVGTAVALPKQAGKVVAGAVAVPK